MLSEWVGSTCVVSCALYSTTLLLFDMAQRFHTTVTERGSFRTCRRQWYEETQNRLSSKGQVAWYFLFGDCIHKALEAYYTDNKRDLATMMRAFKRAWKKENDRLHAEYGSLAQTMLDEWFEYFLKGEQMLIYYDMYDRQAEWQWDEVIDLSIEERGFIDILNPFTEERLPGLPLLSGKIDMVVRRKDGIWIVDHKTAASAYDARALDIDDQLTGYCYIYWRLTGTMPRGAVYNALIKDPPKPPNVLKSGELSKDKAQRTTHDLYLQAIEDNDLDTENYTEILAYLKEKKWSQFFLRDVVMRNEEELLSFERRLYHEYQDMERVLVEPELRYPNPGQRICGGCRMIPLCQAMEEQNDEWVRETMYEQIPPRTQIPKKIQSDKWEGV